MRFENYEQAVNFLSSSELLSYDDSFDLGKYCGLLLRKSEEEKRGRDIVIRIRDAWRKVPDETKSIWNELTESAGLYPYLEGEHLSGTSLLRYEYHKSPFLNEVYLHEEQAHLSIELQSDKSVVVSAPTSFGKSLLIEEVIASRKYQQIVIIQPTLALLDETRKKLLKYREYYKIIVSTNQQPDERKGNVFLFTGERVMEYISFPNIDFFIIDEFYKLSLDRDDDRAIPLNQAFNKLLKQTNKFYLLGPVIQNIPVNLKEKFDLTWYPTDFATVAVNEMSFEAEKGVKAKDKKEYKKRRLFEFLSTERDQTLIYCSSPNKATTLALEFTSHLKQIFDHTKLITGKNLDIQDWLKENINDKWSLIDSLNYGVGFHHGALPRHLGSSIVDSFNNGDISYLFCTSTLIEGVNTSAKTVIMFDKEKGNKMIDFFDYKNIAGRSGRMKKHFIGNVIRFEKQPDQMELFVDIPLFNQNSAPLEILISLDENEVEEQVKYRLKDFHNLPSNLQQVLKKHSSISIDGQLAIVKQLESNLSGYAPMVNWTSFPTYDQLVSMIDLAWTFLLKPGENKADIRSAAQLAFLTIKYARLQSISAIINDLVREQYWIDLYAEEQLRIDRVTFFVLNVTRHWFDYKLPKWLSVISDLQAYVFGKSRYPSGNFSYFASSLEHSFLPPELSALMEYDIPYSAIIKLRKIVGSYKQPEDIVKAANSLSNIELKQLDLLQYEINKLRDAF
jgi:hypothetical protein